ncbi:hypothetical protein AGMMS50256_30190 [Betaproteobacteria bacterium]|nr:hypothetical protein AGMMS50256_30190 [Betaproteobacteria bacterium]
MDRPTPREVSSFISMAFMQLPWAKGFPALALGAALWLLAASPARAAMSDDDFYGLCFDGAPRQIREALAGGANVNARGSAGEGLHWTILTCAAANGDDPETLRALLEKGADANARDEDGATTLMRAAYANENPAAITVLLRAGAQVNTRDKDGATPLMYAAMGNANPEVIAALLDAGADPGARDKQGKRAADHAAGNAPLRKSAAFRRLAKPGHLE